MHSLIAWFARNGVAANLLMAFIAAAGISALARVPLEVFPSFELDVVSVTVPFRGASPEEVEQGVTIRIEEAIADLEGITRITSRSAESLASINATIDAAASPREVADEIEQRIAGIGNLPAEAERASVSVPRAVREVISVVVSGPLPEDELRSVASRVRDELEALPEVSQVRLTGVRDYELAIEVPAATLERYGLTLADVSAAIETSSLDLAAGRISTGGGEVLLRARGQAAGADDYADVVVLARPDGTRVTLGEVADISDGFAEERLEQRWNGLRAIEIDVYRTGRQSAIGVADAVKAYVDEAGSTMPWGVELGYWRDWSRVVKARLDTLTSSAVQGGLLIVALLALFLRPAVALWVFLGVPVAVLGGAALMPIFGVSLNLLSMFAFILVLGIVVDDAIVTGENVYTHMRRNPDRVEAAIAGTQEVAIPVTFGVLTTVAAFTPLLLIEGARGQIFAQIPLIVIPVLLFSIVESKFVLPSHLSHVDFFSDRPVGRLGRAQARIADGFERFVDRVYQPGLAAALANRYLTLSVFVGVAIVAFALVSSGRVRFVFFPTVQSEIARGSLEMPEGTDIDVTAGHLARMTDAVATLQARHVDPENGESVIENVMTSIGSNGRDVAGHVGRVTFEIVPPEERRLDVSSAELVAEWRELIGDVPGAEGVSYRAEIGRGGSPIDVELSGQDFERLREMVGLVRAKLAEYPGITEISDSFEGGKEEIRLVLTPAGRQLGVTLADLARQVRTAFLGTEVQSLQRNRDEVRVEVRYPEAERSSIESLRSLRVRTAAGVDVPLSSVADLELARGLSAINRIDRRRTVSVEAEVDKESANIEGIKADVEAYAASIAADFPDVTVSLEGEAREQRESFRSLRIGLVFVLLAIYALLAIPFRSYLQPLLVMAVIPFGVVGGILGHLIMGMPLSIMSYMGMLALCGVVVNDSLVLVDWVNRQRAKGLELVDAVRTSGVARFRAVILTSLTTFFGLVPLIFETSTQAQFLIPMAVSLGYGILFATLVTLVLIPVNYLVLEDLRALPGRLRRGGRPRRGGPSKTSAVVGGSS